MFLFFNEIVIVPASRSLFFVISLIVLNIVNAVNGEPQFPTLVCFTRWLVGSLFLSD